MKFLRVLLLLLMVWPNPLLAQGGWEYVFSQRGMVGSEIHDMLLIGDQVVLAGAASTCHAPAIWFFDTSGTLQDQKILSASDSIGNKIAYGKITEIKYDSTNHKLIAIGSTSIADDVGPNVATIFLLDVDHNVDTIYRLPHLHPHGIKKIAFLDSLYVVNAANLIFVLNEKFEIIERIKIEFDALSGTKLIYTHENIISHQAENYYGGKSITLYNQDGDTIRHVETPIFRKLLVYGRLVVIHGEDHVVRFYDRISLQELDSLHIEIPPQSTIQINNRDQLEVATYTIDIQPRISIYDTNAIMISHYPSDLPGEVALKNFYFGKYVYQSGKYYDTGGQATFGNAGLLNFIRKRKVLNPELIPRPSIEICCLSILDSVGPDECITFSDGEVFCYFSGRIPSHYKVQIINSGEMSIHNFAIHTDLIYSFNCVRGLTYHSISDVELSPGDTLELLDSFYLYNYLSSLNIHIVAPNQLLHSNVNFVTSFAPTTSSKDWQTLPLKIYPNPVLDHLYINDTSPVMGRIEIFDIHGQLIQAISSPNNHIDVSHLAHGMYILQVRNGNQLRTARFIKH